MMTITTPTNSWLVGFLAHLVLCFEIAISGKRALCQQYGKKRLNSHFSQLYATYYKALFQIHLKSVVFPCLISPKSTCFNLTPLQVCSQRLLYSRRSRSITLG